MAAYDEDEIGAEPEEEREWPLPDDKEPHIAVCCDYEKLGLVERDKWNEKTKSYGPEKVWKDMVRIYWQLGDEIPSKPGTRFLVSEDYVRSMHPKSNLFKLLDGWICDMTKRDFDHEPFRPSEIVGQPCLLSIRNKKLSRGGSWTNVTGATRLPRSMPAIKPENYKRPERKEAAPQPSGAEEWDS